MSLERRHASTLRPAWPCGSHAPPGTRSLRPKARNDGAATPTITKSGAAMPPLKSARTGQLPAQKGRCLPMDRNRCMRPEHLSRGVVGPRQPCE